MFLDRLLAFWSLDRFSVHGDIQAVFDTEPPESILGEVTGDIGGIQGEVSELPSEDEGDGSADSPENVDEEFASSNEGDTPKLKVRVRSVEERLQNLEEGLGRIEELLKSLKNS